MIKYKPIQLTDEQWSQVAANAVACGFRVGRGPKSQLARFIVAAAKFAEENGMRLDDDDQQTGMQK